MNIVVYMKTLNVSFFCVLALSFSLGSYAETATEVTAQAPPVARPMIKANHSELGCQHLLDIVDRNIASDSGRQWVGYADRADLGFFPVSANAGSPSSLKAQEDLKQKRITLNKLFDRQALLQKHPELQGSFSVFSAPDSSPASLVAELGVLNAALISDLEAEITFFRSQGAKDNVYLNNLEDLKTDLAQASGHIGSCFVVLDLEQSQRAQSCFARRLHPQERKMGLFKALGTTVRLVGASIGLANGMRGLQAGDPRAMNWFELARVSSSDLSSSGKFLQQEAEHDCYERPFQIAKDSAGSVAGPSPASVSAGEKAAAVPSNQDVAGASPQGNANLPASAGAAE